MTTSQIFPREKIPLCQRGRWGICRVEKVTAGLDVFDERRTRHFAVAQRDAPGMRLLDFAFMYIAPPLLPDCRNELFRRQRRDHFNTPLLHQHSNLHDRLLKKPLSSNRLQKLRSNCSSAFNCAALVLMPCCAINLITAFIPSIDGHGFFGRPATKP